MSFILARLKSQSVPKAKELPVAVGSAWEVGALLVVDANGAWAECGADPAAIGGVAESPVGTNTTGFGSIAGKREFPPGRCIGTAVQDEVSFKARYVGALPAANGGSYGVVRDADGLWKVDFTETVATRVKLVNRFTDAPIGTSLVEVVFLPANVQIV